MARLAFSAAPSGLIVLITTDCLQSASGKGSLRKMLQTATAQTLQQPDKVFPPRKRTQLPPPKNHAFTRTDAAARAEADAMGIGRPAPRLLPRHASLLPSIPLSYVTADTVVHTHDCQAAAAQQGVPQHVGPHALTADHKRHQLPAQLELETEAGPTAHRDFSSDVTVAAGGGVSQRAAPCDLAQLEAGASGLTAASGGSHVSMRSDKDGRALHSHPVTGKANRGHATASSDIPCCFPKPPSEVGAALTPGNLGSGPVASDLSAKAKTFVTADTKSLNQTKPSAAPTSTQGGLTSTQGGLTRDGTYNSNPAVSQISQVSKSAGHCLTVKGIVDDGSHHTSTGSGAAPGQVLAKAIAKGSTMKAGTAVFPISTLDAAGFPMGKPAKEAAAFPVQTAAIPTGRPVMGTAALRMEPSAAGSDDAAVTQPAANSDIIKAAAHKINTPAADLTAMDSQPHVMGGVTTAEVSMLVSARLAPNQGAPPNAETMTAAPSAAASGGAAMDPLFMRPCSKPLGLSRGAKRGHSGGVSKPVGVPKSASCLQRKKAPKHGMHACHGYAACFSFILQMAVAAMLLCRVVICCSTCFSQYLIFLSIL